MGAVIREKWLGVVDNVTVLKPQESDEEDE